MRGHHDLVDRRGVIVEFGLYWAHRLAHELLQRGSLSLPGAPQQTIRRITLVDRADAPAALLADADVVFDVGGRFDAASHRYDHIFL